MQRRPLCLALVALSALIFSASTVLAKASERCPRVKTTPKVYLMGSSTMGSILGPMLQSLVDKEWGVEARRWGKASSGLARPDFHDWPDLLPGLMDKHRPDIVVVSLGTNDNQPLWVRKGVWIRLDNPKWETYYAERVRETLQKAAGKDRRRLVIWMGPTAFEGKVASVQGPIINRIVQREVQAFDGKAIFVDSYAATSDAKGHPRKTFKIPGSKKTLPAFGDDGIHLTTEAVRWLLAEPVRQHIGACVAFSKELAAAKRAEPEPEVAAEEPPIADGKPLVDGTAETDADPGSEADETDEPTPAPETDEEEAETAETPDPATAPSAEPEPAQAPAPDKPAATPAEPAQQ
ncbi:MAG: DUF459 domain-containing protein [Myxococcota bacterium]